MNQTELLDQFILEARECLERIGQRLLDVERAPDDRELLNDLFRAVHTLKGNCGLFEFKALETTVHGAEDVLDQVRNAALAYSPEIADALLEALDYTTELVDAIEAQGRQPEGSEARAAELAAALRRHLGGGMAAPVASSKATPVPASASAPAAEPLPAWAADCPEDWRRPGRVLLRYRPEPECFFKGEDPWHLACTAPGLKELQAGTQQAWPPAADFDCYQCNLELLLACEAPLAYVQEHFRYVPEQIETHVLADVPAAGLAASGALGTQRGPGAHDGPDAASPAMLALRHRIGQVWQEQRQLIARPGVSAGALAAARCAFEHLLALRDDGAAADAAAELAGVSAGATALGHWARRHAPGGAGADADGAAAPVAAPPEPRRGATPVHEEHGSGGAQKVLKVAQDKIDRLMDLIGEMVVAKNALPYLAARAEDTFGQRELAREIKAQYSVINRIAEDMQHAIMQVRMLPVGTVFQRFGRLVRDLSKKLGKEVQLVVEGEDTEADKNVIESLADPLIHILRNSLDHGLETPEARRAAGKPASGTLRVAASQEGDRVIIEISDDGAGIDTARVRAKAVERGLIPADRADALSEVDAVQLVFLPGFSTAESISDLSGRGVGMDVVRSAVERVNGTVELSSRRGQGTTIRLALPLSMAVTNVMMIEVGGRHFGVPMDLIVETVRVPAEDIHSFKRAQTTVLRGRIVPLRALHDLLALDVSPRANAEGELAVLVVRHGGEHVGLLVDDFHGTSDIILKPLEGVLAGMTGFAGTALMGDGSVLMILNPKELV